MKRQRLLACAVLLAALWAAPAQAAEPLYDTRMGPRTATQVATELRSVGYNGPTDLRSLFRAYEHAAPRGTVDADIVMAADWAQAFWQRPESYFVLNAGSNTPCGALHAAFYCRLDRTVYIDRTWFSQTVEHFSITSVVMVVAHEFTHLNQHEIPEYDNQPTVAKELQADCMAGATIAWVNSLPGTGLTQAGLDAARTLIGASGDPSHGNGYSRDRAFMTGYQNGPGPC